MSLPLSLFLIGPVAGRSIQVRMIRQPPKQRNQNGQWCSVCDSQMQHHVLFQCVVGNTAIRAKAVSSTAGLRVQLDQRIKSTKSHSVRG